MTAHGDSVQLSGFQSQLTDLLAQIGPVLFYLVVWGLVFVGTALLVGLFVPFITGDTLLFSSGIIAATVGASVNIWVLAIGIGIAAVLSDQIGFAAGRRLGRPLLDRRGGRRTKALVIRADQFYRLHGWWSVVVGRFVPWARVFIPILAGASRMRFLRFASANAVGALVWGVGITVIGYYAATSPQVKTISYLIAGVCILLSVAAGIRAWYLDRRISDSSEPIDPPILRS